MTQYYPIVINEIQAPNFQALFDGLSYQIIVTWNTAAQRYYINIYENTGALIVATPLTVTSSGIELLSLVWDRNQQIMTAEMAYFIGTPRPVGQIVKYTLQDCDPDSLNKEYECNVLSPTTFSFSMVSDPGPINRLGSAQRYLNMIGPWFKISTLIFRDDQFEVRP